MFRDLESFGPIDPRRADGAKHVALYLGDRLRTALFAVRKFILIFPLLPWPFFKRPLQCKKLNSPHFILAIAISLLFPSDWSQPDFSSFCRVAPPRSPFLSVRQSNYPIVPSPSLHVVHLHSLLKHGEYCRNAGSVSVILQNVNHIAYSLAAIGLSQSKSSEMPAQAANGSSSNPASPLGQGGVVESNSDDKFLFTSESVGEGHPGERTAKYGQFKRLPMGSRGCANLAQKLLRQ